jgi:nucleoside-diphosphate-sugar epimerase
MRVLVTGHRGYIGVEMVPFLRKAGHDIVGLDIDYYDGNDFGGAPDPCDSIDVDLRDVKPEHLRGFDAVIHLAALSNDPIGDLNKQITYDINHIASVKLAESAKAAGVPRYIFSSSCSLYGAGGDQHLDETAAFYPVTAYGESKVKTEIDVAKLADETFTPVYMRNATAYGVSRRLRADIVVTNLTGTAFTTGKVLLTSDGTPWRPLVHIGDITRAFLAALEAPKAAVHNQAFNIGRTTENFRIRDVAEMVAKVVPNCEVGFADGASPDLRNYKVDFTKAEKHLPGYKPEWTLLEGIRETYEAMKKNKLTKEEFTGPRYYRLKTIKGLIDRGEIDGDLRRKRA